MAKETKIDKTAHVHPKACLDTGVAVGPFTIIGEKVKIGSQTRIGSSCVIDGITTIGKNCQIFTGAVIGSIPQDLKYRGEDTRVHIGDGNIIREYVTINLGTVDSGTTSIGDRNLLMAYTHIAHDCCIHDETIIANAGTFAGHVTVENKAVIGGMVAIHQFVRVGKLAIIGGCSKVVQDIPPFSMVDGHPARIYGLNSVGLKRANVSAQSVKNLKRAFKMVFFMQMATLHAAQKVSEELGDDAFVAYLLEFIKKSKRGVCKGL